MKIPTPFVVAVLLACVASIGLAQQKFTAAEAKDHMGEQATVCGKVVATRYAAVSRTKPTFLTLDKPFPGQIFVIVIKGRDRQKFGKPELKYKNKSICATGKITQLQGLPQIEVKDPGQIQIEAQKPPAEQPAKKAP